MATGPVVNQGKGKFLREFLRSNRDAKVVDAAAAWQAEGHEDGISESLVSKIRSELGLTGKRGSNGRATEEAATPPAKGKSKLSPKGAEGKSKKSEDSPLLPDVQESKGPSRSAFVEGLLGREPGANLKKVNEAWTSAGHEGQISPSIYHKVKRERVGTGRSEVVGLSDGAPESGPSPEDGKALPTASRTEPTPKAAKPHKADTPVEVASPMTSPTISHQVPDHGRELHEIEGEIDELMYRLKGLGSFAEVQEALRTARRLLVRSHEH